MWGSSKVKKNNNTFSFALWVATALFFSASDTNALQLWWTGPAEDVASSSERQQLRSSTRIMLSAEPAHISHTHHSSGPEPVLQTVQALWGKSVSPSPRCPRQITLFAYWKKKAAESLKPLGSKLLPPLVSFCAPVFNSSLSVKTQQSDIYNLQSDIYTDIIFTLDQLGMWIILRAQKLPSLEE